MPVRASLRPMLALVNALRRLPRVHAAAASVPERRAQAARTLLQMRNTTARARRPVETTDFSIAVSGGEIMVRRYRRVGPRTSLPAHVFFHGGSFWLGSVAEYEPLCRWYAARVGCSVFSVEYRLAPEFPYPQGLEDCYAALCWVAAGAGELAVDPERISVGGVSAGGTLAAAVALLARDRSGPPLVLQVLEIPATDLTLNSASIDEFADGYLLTKAAIVEGNSFYLSDPAEALEAYASPLFATDLTGLPPAHVLTCECDPLRDEGEAYAARLAEAGIAVTGGRVPGHLHGSMYLTRLLPSARRTVESTCLALSTAYQTARG